MEELLQYTTNWMKGEVLQGKTMIIVGVVLILALVFIAKGENILLKGTQIPLGIIISVLVGYGSYVVLKKPLEIQENIEIYKQQPDRATEIALERQTKDYNNYKNLIRIYPILMLLAVSFVIFTTDEYSRGMAIGFLLLFCTAYTVDSCFMSRTVTYLEFLKSQ